MNYLESLSSNERYIVSEIIENWKKISLSDSFGMPLYVLLEKLVQHDCIKIEKVAYQIDPIDGGEINIHLIFRTQYIEEIFGKDHELQFEKHVAQTIKKLLIGCSFIQKLHQDGLIYCPEESFDPSTFDEWDVPCDKYPKSNYIWKTSSICSKGLAKFLDSFLQSSICPSYQLINFCDNNFETPEQIRFKKSQCLSKIGILTAIFISVFSPWLMTKCSHTTIEQSQFDSIINTIPSAVEEVRISKMQLDSLIMAIKPDATNGKVENAKP